MKKLLAIYNGNVVVIYQDGNHYYFTNAKGEKKELRLDEFTFIA